MKVDLLDPVVAAAPGDAAIVRVRVVNDRTGPASYRVRMVGLHDDSPEIPIGDEQVPPGGSVDFDVDIRVPRAFAAGRHALAVEVVSDRRDDRPALAGLTVEVGSHDQVSMSIDPSTIIGRWRGRFELAIDNRERRPVELSLSGAGQELDVRLSATHVIVPPGETIHVQGKVSAPRRFVRDTIGHVLTIVAEGRAAPVYAEAAYKQRPLIPRRLNATLAVLVLVGLWAGIVGAGAWWFSQRDDERPGDAITSALVRDTDGDGRPDSLAPLGEGDGDGDQSTDGGGTTDGSGDGSGGGAGGGGEEAGEPPARITRPTSTTISGTVKAGSTGDDAGVRVSIVPTRLGLTPPDASEVAGGGGESAPTKFWSARYGRNDPVGVSPTIRTASIDPTFTDEFGVWAIPNVLIPDNYEIAFAKEGFDTQSFVVTPPEDGKAVEIEVVLEPATGSASGVTLGRNAAGAFVPIGGVELVLTDGTLRFTTTSSTAPGSLGEWSLGGLSTPNVYTLSASLRGYGTEVVQVDMGPGAVATPAIRMVPGVGSVGGRVTADGEAFGGATITVTGGDLTRTTTSLTLGDVGSFDLPQLPIPGTYIVSASAPGYMTQTREIALNGAVGGVDFALTRTTATLVGVVTGDRSGPLVNVGITVRQDDLMFSATTADAPSAGAFRLEDLPPGPYVVSFLRFDHRPASRLIELEAGQTLDLGEIMLAFQARAALEQGGNVTVDVQNSEGEELTGATVTLTPVGGDGASFTLPDPDDPPSAPQASFEFVDVPIGTYTVLVERPNYRSLERRVSIGLGDVTLAPFQLFRLGQVSGRVVDSITGDQLRNYQIRIWRLNEDGTRVSNDANGYVEQITVTSTDPPTDVDGNIRWQSEPSTLTDGLYEIEITDSPPGYVIQPQVISDATAPALMRFRIEPDSEDVVVVDDLRADRFPTVSGRIFTPLLVTPTTPANTVEYIDLPDDSTVTMRCGSGPNVPGQLVERLPAAPGTYEYRFPRTTIETQNLIGPDCSVTVTASGFDPVTKDLLAPLTVSNGASTDQTLNVVLAPTVPAIAGQVYWIDQANGAELPIDGVDISTTDGVIIDFLPTTGPPTNDDAVRVPSLSTTSLDGAWALDEQVFGETVYTFTEAGYTDTLITIRIDQNGRVVSASLPTLFREEAPGGSITVFLRPTAVANGVRGTVEIVTADGTTAYSSVGISADGPTTAPAAVTANSAGAWSIPSAQPGTWDVRFTTPSNHVLHPAEVTVPGQPTQVARSGRLEPNDELVLPAVRYVELGRIEVTIEDQAGDPIADPDDATIRPEVTITRVANPVPGDPTGAITNPTREVAADGTVVFNGLAVNLTDPLGSAATYQLATDFDGYDEATPMSVVTIGTETFGPYPAAAIPVDLLAGQDAEVTIVLARQGTLRGEVVGVSGTAEEDLTLDDPDVTTDTGATVTATLKWSVDGTLLPVEDHVVGTVSIDPDDPDNGFVVSGPPGWYEITASHPFFQAATPSSYPTPDPLLPVVFPDTAPPNVYLLENIDASGNDNDPLDGPIRLQVEPGTIVVEALTESLQPIEGALVSIDGGTPQATAPSSGAASFDTLLPGTYTVDVTFETSDPLAPVKQRFPVQVDVTVPKGASEAARTITVKAVLLTVGGSIEVTVSAVNGGGRPVALPEDVTITREYVTSSDNDVIIVGSSTSSVVPNTLDESAIPTTLLPNSREPSITLIRVAEPPDPDAATPLVFPFVDLPAGAHELGYSDESSGGYSLGLVSDPNPVVVSGLAGTNVTVEYEANPVDVTITLTSSSGGAITAATVTLVSPIAEVPDQEIDGSLSPQAGGVYVFDDVLPEAGAYTLLVTAPRHDPLGAGGAGQALPVTVDPDGELEVPVTLNATTGAIVGTAERLDTESGSAIGLNVGAGSGTFGTVSIFDPSDAEIAGSPVTPDADGDFEVDVTVPGTYTVRVDKPGYTSVEDTVTVVLGEENEVEDLPRVKKLAGATVRVQTSGLVGAGDFLVTQAVPSIGSPPTCTPTIPSGGGTIAQCEFTGLDPDVGYRWTISGTNVFNTPTPGASTTFDPQIGVTTDVTTVTPAQRTVQIHVRAADSSGAAAGDILDATFEIVTPKDPDPDIVRDDTTGVEIDGSNNANDTGLYEIFGVDFGAANWSVARSGYRTRTGSIAATTGSSSSAPLVISTAGSPTVLHPLVSVSGALCISGTSCNNNDSQRHRTPTTVTATQLTSATGTPTGLTRTTTSTTSGTYSFTGGNRLDVGFWRISVAVAGSYADERVLAEITQTSSSSLTSQNLDLAPRDVEFQFTVSTDTGTVFVTGADVTFRGSALTDTDAGGQTDATVPENTATGSFAWSVSKTGFVTASGSYSWTKGFPATQPVPINVPLTRTPITGTVVDADDDPVTGATVLLCAADDPDDADDVCAVGEPTVISSTTSSAVSGSEGTYSLASPPAGSYRLRAVSGPAFVEVSITINAQGSVIVQELQVIDPAPPTTTTVAPTTSAPPVTDPPVTDPPTT